MSDVRAESLAKRLNGKLYRIGVMLVGAYLVVISFGPMMAQTDLGWHVAQGRWMVEHGAIYRHDVFNYPNLGHPVVDEYPLFQVVLYLAWGLGWWGPSVLTAVANTILVAVLARGARGLGVEGSFTFLASLGMMLLYFQLSFPLRPHLVTYLGIAITGVFLLRHRTARSWMEFWPLALFQVAWTNCHSGFVIGSGMVGLFGLEMTLREGISSRAWPWSKARIWLGAFLFILLACLLNPFGIARFYPPFYQDRLESIRAYVGEMQPLARDAASLYGEITLLAVGLVLLGIIARRGAVSGSFLFLALVFYVEALTVQKSWPVFGVFLPLLVLSAGAFAREGVPGDTAAWFSALGNLLVAVSLGMALSLRLDGVSGGSLQVLWRQYDEDRRELSYPAAPWMKAHGIEGRLLHRCEDGGLLQEQGYDHGETFADTGFGKYDARFIHLVGMLGERPALLPDYIQTYRPDYAVCNNFCYQWPYYLRQQGWRLIFYSPYGSVWTRAGLRTDLPTVSGDEVKAALTGDVKERGLPLDRLLYGRNLIALQSAGLEDFAFQQLTSLPEPMHHAAWYWEAARILCFETPPFSAAHRAELAAEANRISGGAATEFRAYVLEAAGENDGARRLLTAVPIEQLSGHELDLLLRVDLAEKRPEALALAERPVGADLREGGHWELVAEAETQAGHEAAAARAWSRAVFYNPDEVELMKEAGMFAAQFHDAELAHEVATGLDLRR